MNKEKKTPYLSITRNDPQAYKEKFGEDLDIFWMNTTSENEQLLTTIEKKIKEAIQHHKQPVIILERLDYLITLFGFDTVLKFIYSLHDHISRSTATFIVHTNPHILTDQQKTLLSLELRELPKPEFVEKIQVAKDLHEILEFLQTTNTKISFKTICKKFNITKATARKRIYQLYNNNLIIIKKDGRSKLIELTKRGNQALST